VQALATSGVLLLGVGVAYAAGAVSLIGDSVTVHDCYQITKGCLRILMYDTSCTICSDRHYR
jgi:hypothetical protein